MIWPGMSLEQGLKGQESKPLGMGSRGLPVWGNNQPQRLVWYIVIEGVTGFYHK